MNPTIRIILFIFVSAFVLTLTAWLRGNENMYTYEERVQINPVELKSVKDYNPSYDYYRIYTLVDIVKPSSIPGVFETTTDTLAVTIEDDLR